jgi:hypothetical protein
VPIVMFFILMTLVGVGISVLGYGLSFFEEQTVGRRCRMPHQMYRMRKVTRQRVRCRFEA